MNAADTIRAAIDHLEQQRDTAMRGPWVPGTFEGEFIGPDDHDSLFSAYNADLVLTLHRTIDAQLRILREAEYQIGQDAGFVAREFNLFLPLARAILGEDTE